MALIKLKMPSWFAFTLSLISTVLHIGCCVIPLFSAAFLSFSNLTSLIVYKPFFTVFQFVALICFAARLLGQQINFLRFHSRQERISYQIGFVLLIAGATIGYLEPFKTENQTLAEQHFQRFKLNRSVELILSGTCDRKRMKRDMDTINGVRKSQIVGDLISISFVSGQTTSTQIIETLKRQGYEVQRK